jgi:diguanylate cyclase (GGDEF)-like protein
MSEFEFGIDIGLGIFSCAILIFLYAAVRGKTTERITHRRRQGYFLALVACSFIMSLADMLSRLDGRPGICVPICRVGNFVLFFFGPLQVILWFQYLGEQIGIRAGESRKIGYTLYALGALECMLVLISLKTRWLYYFDSSEVYHRGPFFTLSCVIVMFMMLFCEAEVIVNRDKVDKRYLLPLVAFPLIPIVGSFLQIAFYGIAFSLNSSVYALLIVFVYVQNRNLDTDYLTGVYNRRKLDMRMEQAIRMSADGRTFAAILIDIDQFKNINDTLGHPTGDAALEDAAGILRESLRTDTFIARYGGDEFCVLLNVAEADDLDVIMERINKNAERFNAVSGKPYQLRFSMGGAVYAPASQMDMKEFLMLIDTLMYKNKQRGGDAAVEEKA